MSRTLRRRLGHALRRLDHTLGRLVYRMVGVVAGLLTLGAGRALMSALATGQIGSAAVLVAIVSALGALTVYCFGRGRRLSDLES